MAKKWNFHKVLNKDSSFANEDTNFLDQILSSDIADIVDDPEAADHCIINESPLIINSTYFGKLMGCPFIARFHHKVLTIKWPDNPNGILRGAYINKLKHL